MSYLDDIAFEVCNAGPFIDADVVSGALVSLKGCTPETLPSIGEPTG